MFSNNEESSKSELDGINLHSVSNNLADIKGELMDVRRGLQVIPSDINNDSSRDHIPIEEIENLTETFQNKETELLSSRSENISSEGHLELNDYNQHSQSCEEDREIPIETVDNSETSLNLNTNHYYDNLSAAPIMVYQMPCGNFVPFDSLVSVPIAKAGESKTNESIDLLSNHYASQEMLINSQNTYTNTQPHFLLPENIKYKGQLNDKMFVSQIPVYSSDDSANLFLDARQSLVRNNRCELNLGEPVNTDMNLGTDVGFHTNPTVTSDPNVHHLTCFTSTTDSEVALTLASLGNVKSDKMQQNLSGNLPFTFENISKPVDDKVIFPTSVENENKFSSCISDENEFPHHSSSNSLHIDINSGDLQLKHNTHKIKINDNSGIKSITKAKGFGKTSRSKVQNLSKRTPQSNSSDVIHSQNSLKEEKELHDPRKKNLLGQLLKASKQCEPASLIPEGVVDDVIPAVGYRIMDVSNLSEMIRMMHRCSNTSSKALIVVQEQASLREGAVSQLSVICTGCKEGAVCATSSKSPDNGFDINARVEMLKKEFNIEESQFQKMLEILGIFYRIKPPMEEKTKIETNDIQEEPEKKRKKVVKNHQKLECKICHKVVSGKNYLKIHMLMHDNMLHTCPYCQAYFKRVFNLREHIKKHENVKFECNSCHKRYSDRSTLLAHIKSIHLAEYRLECEICSKRFFHKAHFEAHLRVHTKEKPFSCDFCGKRYAHMTSVKKHMQSHVTGTKYKCRLCGKLYRAQFGIRQHLMQQHKVKKSDIEAQVITDVIAEVCPPPSAPVVSSKQLTNDAKNSQCLDENIDNEDSPEELENLNKEYFQNIPVSSGSTVVSFHSSKNQVDSPKILSNWKKPL